MTIVQTELHTGGLLIHGTLHHSKDISMLLAVSPHF